jgi:hypothetical protein
MAQSHRFATWFLKVTNSNLEAALVRIYLKRIDFSFDQHAGTAHTIDLTYLVLLQGGDRFVQ